MNTPIADADSPAAPALHGRALVLGSGGVTGIAWEIGILEAFEAAGVGVGRADIVLGSSAGALVGAHLTLGASAASLATDVVPRLATHGRLTPRALALMLAAQLAPDRQGALVRLGRRGAGRAVLEEPEWVELMSERLAGAAWPAALRVAAINALTGELRVFGPDDGVDLARAVAASCAVPSIFPGVTIDGAPYMDGGLASLANIDLVAGSARVLALTPFRNARDPARRPGAQLRALPDGTSWLHLWPDSAAARAVGADPLRAERAASALDQGRRQGRARVTTARRIWG